MQRIGVFLMCAGLIVAAGYGAYRFFAFDFQSVHLALKIAIFAAGSGLLLILISLIRERMKTSREDRERFKGVDQ